MVLVPTHDSGSLVERGRTPSTPLRLSAENLATLPSLESPAATKIILHLCQERVG